MPQTIYKYRGKVIDIKSNQMFKGFYQLVGKQQKKEPIQKAPLIAAHDC